MQTKEIGGYRLEEQIGRGGMGLIYRAVHLATGQVAAVKMLHPHLVKDPSVRERFLREARAQARLTHPHITEIRSLLEEEGNYYIFMEFLEGQTLADRLKESGPIPPEEGLPILRQVLDAVAHAHGLGILHRDLKPSNVMILPKGIAKVMDFGTAKILDAESLTLSGMTVGSPLYMSPEQLLGEQPSPVSDVYSLGITLYQMCTGKPPYEGASLAELLRRLTDEPPVPPRRHRPSIDPELEEIILKAIAKEKGERHPSIEAFRETLDRHRMGLRPQEAPEEVPGRKERRGWDISGWSIIIGLFLLSILFAIFPFISSTFPLHVFLIALVLAFGLFLILALGYTPRMRHRGAGLCPRCKRDLGENRASCPYCGWRDAAVRLRAYLVEANAEGEAVSWPLPTGTITIGSEAPCQIILRDDRVSSRHAEIRHEDGGIVIVDLGSADGTIVNGSRLEPDRAAPIYDGDRIGIGAKALLVKATPD